MASYDTLLQRGNQFLQADRLSDAIHAFAGAAELRPNEKEPLTQLGMICKELGDADGAVAFLTRAAALDDDDAYVRLNLGLIEEAQGNYQEAVQHLKEAILLIVHGVVATRLEVMISGHRQADAVLAKCDDLELTAQQAQEFLLEITAKMQRGQSA